MDTIKHECSTCKSAYLEKIWGTKFNCKCGLMDKIIDCSIEQSEVKNVLTPVWCPKNHSPHSLRTVMHPIIGTPQQQQQQTNHAPMIKTVRMMWDEVTPKVTWENIMKDDIYHVPPYMDVARTDIQIVFKCATYCTYRKLNLSGYQTFTMYPSDLMCKVMIKSKTKEYKNSTIII